MSLTGEMAKDAGRDARVLVETLAIILLTWLLLGWWFGEPLMRGDGPRMFAPYIRSALEAGPDWSNHQYRFGAFGGSVMHPAVGTSPLVLACSAIGVSTTSAENIGAVFDQLAFGFFGCVMIEALLTIWSSSRRRLSLLQRTVTVWCCAFAPAVGWRFAAGHENLLQGLLPFLVSVSLWWGARARTLSWTSLVVGWLAVFHALPSLGQQMMVFSFVFGAPVTIVTLIGGDRRSRFVREQVSVALVLLAGALCAAPQLLQMLQYQLGDDASRGVSRSMFYAYGHPHLHDWLTSLPWTTAATAHWPGDIPAHETNYPLGPLILFVLALWPRRVARDLGLALFVGVVLAITFSLDLAPVSEALRRIPLVDAFRVPARAMLPILLLVPVVALAALWSRWTESIAGKRRWVMFGFAGACVLVAHQMPSVVREVVAWLACATLGVVLRGTELQRHRTAIAAAVVLLGALAVAAFAERYDTAPAAKRIEDAPRLLRERVLAAAPELTMPLTRVQVSDTVPPFRKSTAFAAGLPTLDGVGFPPRRFLRLLSALWNEPVSAAESDFELRHRDRFDILAQLYNVKYDLERDGALTPLAPTNGPAWFARDVAVIDDPREMIRVLRIRGVDVRATLGRVAWVLRDEAPITLRPDSNCVNARVTDVRTDRLGQSAEIDVEVPGTCVLVVATTYATMLRASDTVHELDVFPVDVALTGIVVPSGTTRVTLGPAAQRQWWLTAFGYFVLAGALAMFAIARTAKPRTAAQG
jgi:hypothetical protein